MPDDSVAELVIVPLIELTTRATIDTVLVAPFASVPGFVQVTVAPAGEQFQPLPDDETYVTFGGNVSRMVKLEDVSGPRLRAVSVYVTSPPAEIRIRRSQARQLQIRARAHGCGLRHTAVGLARCARNRSAAENGVSGRRDVDDDVEEPIGRHTHRTDVADDVGRAVRAARIRRADERRLRRNRHGEHDTGRGTRNGTHLKRASQIRGRGDRVRVVLKREQLDDRLRLRDAARSHHRQPRGEHDHAPGGLDPLKHETCRRALSGVGAHC